MNFYQADQRRHGGRGRRRSYLFIFLRQKCLPTTAPQVKPYLYSEQMAAVGADLLLGFSQIWSASKLADKNLSLMRAGPSAKIALNLYGLNFHFSNTFVPN